MADKGEITTKFKVDVSELKKGISEANQNIKLANAEFRAASAGMDDWAKSSDGIKAKLGQLGSALVEEKKKLENYKKQQQELDKAYEENGKRAEELKAKLAQLAAAGVAKTSDEYKKYKTALSEVEKEQLSNKKASDDMRVTILNQQAAVNRTEKDIRNYETALEKLESESREAKTATGSLTKEIADQQDKLEKLKNEYANVVLQQGKNSVEAKGLSKEIKDLSKELKENEGKLAGAEKQADKFDKTLESTGQTSANVSDGFTIMNGALANLIADGIRRAIDALKDLAVETINVGKSFDSSISQVAAVSGATGDELETLRDKAKEMGASTKFTASEAADAFNYMAMAGWKTEDMLDGIEGVLNLAAASGTDLATTSDIVTDALTAMGKSAGDAERLANIMAAASSNANTNVEMMGETFKYAAPVAGAMGYTMEDTAIAIGLMANSGIKASQAGTSLRSIMSRLAAPVESVDRSMGELGISITNTDGTMKPLNELIQDLRRSFDGLSEAEQAQHATNIAGKNAMSGLLAIVNAAPEDYEKLTTAVENSKDAAKRMSETMQDNLGGDLTQLGSKFEGVQIALYEKFEPALRAGAEMLGNLLEKVGDAVKRIPSIKKFLKAFKDSGTISKLKKNFSGLSKIVANIAKAVFPIAAKVVKFLAENLETLVKVVFGAIAVFKTFNAVMKVANLINSVKTAVSGLSTAIGLAQKAQLLWNGVMNANPLGAVLTAVGLLTIAIGALATKQGEAEESTRVLNERQLETIQRANDAADSYKETKEAAEKNIAAQEANVNYAVNNLLPMLQGVVDENGRVKQGEEERADFILGKLNEALGTEYEQLSDIVDENGKIKDGIYDVIEAKKADMLLTAYEETYLEAVKNVAEARKARALQEKETNKQNELWQEKYQEYLNEQGELEDMLDDKRWMYSEADIIRKKARVSALEKEAGKQREVYDSESRKLGELDRDIYTYYSNIADYEAAKTASTEGNTEKAIDCLNNLSSGYLTAESIVELSVEEQKSILEEQAETYKRIAERTREEYINGVKGVSEETVRIAEEQAENAKKEYYKVGGSISGSIEDGAKAEGVSEGLSEMLDEAAEAMKRDRVTEDYFGIGVDIVKGIAKGIEDKLATGELTGAVKVAMEMALAAAKSAADIHSPSRLFKNAIGKNIGLGIAKGIADTTRNIVKTVKSQIDSIERAYDFEDINAPSVGNLCRSQLAEITRQVSASNNGYSLVNGGHNLPGATTTSYTQIINAPKAPSRIEIYRQTKNLLALKGGT